MSELGPKNLCDLNNDCLSTIFMWLPFRDFEQIRKTCKRFEDIVLSSCRSKYRTWRRMKSYDEVYFNQCDEYDRPCNYRGEGPEFYGVDLRWMVLHMRDVVENLELPHLTQNELLFLQKYQFPNVKSLKVIFHEPGRAVIPVDVFPNLTKLLVEGEVMDLTVVTKLQNLTELELYYPDEHPSSSQLRQIWTQLKLRKFALYSLDMGKLTERDFDVLIQCKTIEDLAFGALPEHFLERIVAGLPNLQKLAYIDSELFEGEDVPWETFFTHFASRVLSFYSAFTYIALNVEDIRAMKSMEKLFLNNCTFRFDNVESEEDSPFPVLREVHCLRKNMHFVRVDPENEDYKAISFLQIFAKCDNLEVLMVPFVWLNKMFYIAELIVMLSAQTRRQRPLELRCWITQSEEDEAKKFQYKNESNLLNVRIIPFPNIPLHWDSQSKDYYKVKLKALNTEK